MREKKGLALYTGVGRLPWPLSLQVRPEGTWKGRARQPAQRAKLLVPTEACLGMHRQGQPMQARKQLPVVAGGVTFWQPWVDYGILWVRTAFEAGAVALLCKFICLLRHRHALLQKVRGCHAEAESFSFFVVPIFAAQSLESKTRKCALGCGRRLRVLVVWCTRGSGAVRFVLLC